jgi:hypothetical protein
MNKAIRLRRAISKTVGLSPMEACVLESLNNKVSLRTGPACHNSFLLVSESTRKLPVGRLGTLVGSWPARRPGQSWL